MSTRRKFGAVEMLPLPPDDRSLICHNGVGIRGFCGTGPTNEAVELRIQAATEQSETGWFYCGRIILNSAEALEFAEMLVRLAGRQLPDAPSASLRAVCSAARS
jgi:hypothetical protein